MKNTINPREAECETTQNFSLADSVGDQEVTRDLTMPANIAELVDIHKNYEPEEDAVDSLEHFGEKKRKLS